MSSKASLFLAKALGEDFMESLAKVELWKPGTRTTIDHEEIKTALKIVPRTIMAILVRELTPMNIGESKNVHLPIPVKQVALSMDGQKQDAPSGALFKVTKHERDVYSGEIIENNKTVVDFKNRSIPGIGLVIMSAFELYDIKEIQAPMPEEVQADADAKLERLIDERLALHNLIEQVVEKKISQRDAMQQMVLAKITAVMAENEKTKKTLIDLASLSESSTAPNPSEYHRGMTNGLKVAEAVVTKEEPKFVDYKKTEKEPKAPKALQKFLDDRKNKLKKGEFAIQMVKGEQVQCPDCGKAIFNETSFSGCICLGDDMDKKVFIKKTEDGVKVRFSKGWDKENIEMLLEVLRKKRV